jgi:hypothetical protein
LSRGYRIRVIPAQHSMFRPFCPEYHDVDDELPSRVRRTRPGRVRPRIRPRIRPGIRPGIRPVAGGCARALAMVARMAHAAIADAAVTELLQTLRRVNYRL